MDLGTKRDAVKDFFIRTTFITTFVIIIAFGAWGGMIAAAYLSDTLAHTWSNVSGNISAAVIELSSRFSPASSVSDSAELVVVDEKDTDLFASDIAEHDADKEASTENSEDNSESGFSVPATAPPPSQIAGTQVETTVPLGNTLVQEDPNGMPDLSIIISAVGILDQTNNEFVEQDSMKITDRGAVSFSVTNAGTKTVSEGWVFSATLPTSPAHIYTSEPQQSLAQGDRIEFMLGFDSVSSADINKNAIVSIVVDPNETLAETTRDNNAAEATIIVED